MVKMSLKQKPAFTIIEVVVALVIFGLISMAAAPLALKLLRGTEELESEGQVRQQSLLFMNRFIKELRTAQPAHDGSYPLSLTNPDEIIFYSDYQADDVIERLRYYLDGETMKGAVIVPRGDPLTYDPDDEEVKDIFHQESPLGSDVFQYYDSSYNGAPTGTPMTPPFDVAEVRLVKFAVLVQPTATGTRPFEFTSQVTIRNLQDN